MTKAEYLSACNRAIAIPAGPRWNSRYVAALKANGLKLLIAPKAPKWFYIHAPKPDPNDKIAGWPHKGVWIVEAK